MLFMDLSEKLTGLLGRDEEYTGALKVAQNNSEGRIWLIGGAVYRKLLFGDCEQAKDYDFIVEEIHNDYRRDDCYYGNLLCCYHRWYWWNIIHYFLHVHVE